MNIELIAQIIGAIAWIFFLLSYYSKNLNKIIFMQIISSVLYCANYGLLGAWGGLFISGFELLKEIGYYKTDKDRYIFYFTIPIYILIAFISEKSILILIPIIASLLDGYGALKSKKLMVITGVISNALWIIYDLYYLDYIVVLTDLMLVISNLSILIYGYTKFLNRDNVYTVSGKYISKDTMNKLYKLDKNYYDSMYLWNIDIMNSLYKSEKNSYILIKDKSEIIGYINILNIDLKVYSEMMNSNKIYDSFENNDIQVFKTKKNYYLSINSIVLKNEYQNKDSVEKIVHSINKFIKTKINKGFKIKRINCFSVNSFETEILEKLNFVKVKNITNECILYEKEII